MSWTEVSSMDSRVCFVAACLREDAAMTVLCARHGISRKTGYKWLERYHEFGAAGLVDRSSAPLTARSRLDSAVTAPILALRKARPTWGPRKLLAREGLVAPRPRRTREPARSKPLIEPVHANDSWSADFKGWFRTGDGVRCEPLTVCDNFSRYLYVAHAVPRPTYAEIKPLFVAAFREHGLPLALRTDNGSPFASRPGLAGLTQFSVWLLKLNIWPDRIAPGRPDQNAKLERTHRTLDEDAGTRPPAGGVSQKKRLDEWRVDYNTQRPHQALGQRCPASLYERSPRAFPEVLTGWTNPADHHGRRGRSDGTIRWQEP